MSEHPKTRDIRPNRMRPCAGGRGRERADLSRVGCSMRLGLGPQHFNAGGRVHGGVTFSLLDSAMRAAVYAHLAPDELTATSECKVNYTLAITGGVLACRALVVDVGSKTMVVDAVAQ